MPDPTRRFTGKLPTFGLNDHTVPTATREEIEAAAGVTTPRIAALVAARERVLDAIQVVAEADLTMDRAMSSWAAEVDKFTLPDRLLPPLVTLMRFAGAYMSSAAARDLGAWVDEQVRLREEVPE